MMSMYAMPCAMPMPMPMPCAMPMPMPCHAMPNAMPCPMLCQMPYAMPNAMPLPCGLFVRYCTERMLIASSFFFSDFKEKSVIYRHIHAVCREKKNSICFFFDYT